MPTVNFSILHVGPASTITASNNYTDGVGSTTYVSNTDAIGTTGSGVQISATATASDPDYPQTSVIRDPPPVNDTLALSLPAALFTAAIPADAVITSVFATYDIFMSVSGLWNVTTNPGSFPPASLGVTSAGRSILSLGDGTTFDDHSTPNATQSFSQSFSHTHEFVPSGSITLTQLLTSTYSEFGWDGIAGTSILPFTLADPMDSFTTLDEATPEALTLAVNYAVTYHLPGPPGPDPAQLSIHPAFGPTAGGTTVEIIGTNFRDFASVTFGGVAATSVVVVNAYHITCVTPAHVAATVDVVVTNADSTVCTLTLVYEYTDMPPPPVPPIQLAVRNSLGTTSGTTKGGTSVTIGGSLFQPGCTVTFGGVAATGVVWISSAEIRCVTPAHAAGAATIVVTNPDGGVCVSPLSFLYVTPRDVVVLLTSSPPWQTLGQWALHRLDLTPTTQGPAGSAGEDS